MRTHVDQQIKSQSDTQKNGKNTLQFSDKRPEMAALKQLQALADTSSVGSQMRAYQALADASPRTLNAARFSANPRASVNREAMEENDSVQGEFRPVQRMMAKDEPPPQDNVAPEKDQISGTGIPLKEGGESSGDVLTKPSTKGERPGTYITHQTAPFQGPEGKPIDLAKRMEARLNLKDPIRGAATDSEDKLKGILMPNRVRGHLLSHDLGGFGVPENLYPITTEANLNHYGTVEKLVENALFNPEEGYEDCNVYYSVDVIGARELENEAIFLCNAHYINKWGQRQNIIDPGTKIVSKSSNYGKRTLIPNPTVPDSWSHKCFFNNGKSKVEIYGDGSMCSLWNTDKHGKWEDYPYSKPNISEYNNELEKSSPEAHKFLLENKFLLKNKGGWKNSKENGKINVIDSELSDLVGNDMELKMDKPEEKDNLPGN
ncbi:hypothetical protein ACO0LM_00650 [Undibacterium sp. Di26W]|uniref:hypothetical protein n=1 Tax=Undibacterium sp. Di26W TaxID=3413035 RepID=UPI003BF20F16